MRSGADHTVESRPRSGARTLGDWLASPELLRPPGIVIPCLAVEGRVTLLSGREKIGKSTLTAGAAAAASRASDVLGQVVAEPIRSLWYGVDEPVSDAVRRFHAMGAEPDGIVINAEPRTMGELQVALARDLDAFPDVGVIWVDTLSRLLAGSGVDPNSSRDVEPVLARLVDYLHEQNIAGVLNYHTGKGGREYRGSTAIGATVDEVLTLRRRGEGDEDDFEEDSSDDGRRLLVQDGRNLRGRVQLRFKDGLYQLYQDTSDPRDRIMAALRSHGVIATRAELVKLAGVRKETGLKVIGELISEGAIIESGRNLKLPKASSAEPNRRGVGFPSSTRFPDAGTGAEPTREPDAAVANGTGSLFGKEGVSETGTASGTSRVVDGVRQILRATQNGERWFDAQDQSRP